MKYVRKISLAKWVKGFEEKIPHYDANADAITGCIRTSGNELSLWEIADESIIEDVIAAIASSMDRLDGFDIIILDKKVVDDAFKIEKSEGKTAYESMKNHHYDIKELKYKNLGDVAKIYIDSINIGHTKKFSRTQVKTILKKKINSGHINVNSLTDKLTSDLS